MLKVSLSVLSNWNPSSVLSTEVANLAYRDSPMKALGELVQMVGDRHVIPKGSKTLSARSLDVSGAWRSQASILETLGLTVNSMTGLREHDLVLYPGRPVIRISPEEAGVAFVGNFMALRPMSEKLSLWLWGLFNTTNGQAWLKRISSVNGAVIPRFPETLLSTLVASIGAEDSNLLTQISELSSSIQATVREVRETIPGPQSWFRRTRITSHTDWNYLFPSKKDFSTFVGRPLNDFIDWIEVGKTGIEMPTTGEVSFPLVNHRTISAGEYGEIRTSAGFQVLGAGTLVVTSNGARSLAAVTDRDAILGKGVFGVHLNSGVDPYWLKDFFNSEIAQVQRKTLVKGVAIPFLTKSALGEFMIPEVFKRPNLAKKTLSEACDVIFDK